MPVYNMLLIALSEDGDEFTGTVWPSDPSFESFEAIWTEELLVPREFLAPVRQQQLSSVSRRWC